MARRTRVLNVEPEHINETAVSYYVCTSDQTLDSDKATQRASEVHNKILEVHRWKIINVKSFL